MSHLQEREQQVSDISTGVVLNISFQVTLMYYKSIKTVKLTVDIIWLDSKKNIVTLMTIIMIII